MHCAHTRKCRKSANDMIASFTLSGEYRAGDDSSTIIIVAFDDAIVSFRFLADPGTPGVTGTPSSGRKLNVYPPSPPPPCDSLRFRCDENSAAYTRKRNDRRRQSIHARLRQTVSHTHTCIQKQQMTYDRASSSCEFAVGRAEPRRCLKLRRPRQLFVVLLIVLALLLLLLIFGLLLLLPPSPALLRHLRHHLHPRKMAAKCTRCCGVLLFKFSNQLAHSKAKVAH